MQVVCHSTSTLHKTWWRSSSALSSSPAWPRPLSWRWRWAVRTWTVRPTIATSAASLRRRSAPRCALASPATPRARAPAASSIWSRADRTSARLLRPLPAPQLRRRQRPPPPLQQRHRDRKWKWEEYRTGWGNGWDDNTMQHLILNDAPHIKQCSWSAKNSEIFFSFTKI